jgi:hypothetical protein
MWTCDYCGETLRSASARPGLRIPACDHLDRCHGSPARGGVGERELRAIAQNGGPVAATGEASTGGAGPLEVQSAGTAAITTAPQTKAADSPETVTKRVRNFIPPDPVSSTTVGFVSLTTNPRGCRFPKECMDVPAVGRFTPLIGSTVIPMPRAACAEQSPTRSVPTGRRRS